MACFLVPGTEAIVVTAAAVLLKKYEQNKTQVKLTANHQQPDAPAKTGFSRKLFWLADLLWGGVILLAFEHLWHGEVVPFFPFLTAATEGPQAVSEMLSEMASVGVLIRSAPILLLFCMIIVAVNMLFCFLGGKLLKFDLEEIILASNANIGGPTTAAGMAISQGWVGTWLGVLVGSILGA